MVSILGTILAFAIVFGVLVFVHEFGHFFMAKLVGVNVETFSFGYGKRLFGYKMGGTDYRISLVPMGGYVKFSGDEALEGIKQNTEPKPGDFQSAKRWQRFLVILMGPVMNVALAVLILAFINMVGVYVPEYQSQAPVIGWIEPGSPAQKADLVVGDEILSINDKKTATWSDVELAVGTKPDRTINIKVKREDGVDYVDLLTESRTRFDMGYAGFFGRILTQVNAVTANSPAEKAGLKPGDVILAIDNSPAYLYRFIETLEKNPGKELDIKIQRNEAIIDLKVTPRKEGNVGKIGIMHGAKSIMRKYGFFSAFAQSYKDNWKMISAVMDFLKDLITGKASTRQLGGPIEIANVSYAFFRMGFLPLMSFIAFISLQLGVVNLFPVPVFDGGQILVLSLEGVFRRDFNPKVKQVLMQIGFAIFIFLMVFIILNDIAKRLPNGWDSLNPF
jgi:regulator of sigma E protease